MQVRAVAGGNGVEGGVGASLKFEERAWWCGCRGVGGEGVEWVVGHGGCVSPIGPFKVHSDGDVVG